MEARESRMRLAILMLLFWVCVLHLGAFLHAFMLERLQHEVDAQAREIRFLQVTLANEIGK